MTFFSPIEIGLIQGLLMAGAVLAFAVAYRLLDFPDLTVEGAVPLGAGTYAVLAAGGLPLTLALLIACAAGMIAGAITATLHVRFGVNKFLAGIIIISIAYSLTLRIMSGPNVSLLQSPSLLGIPRSLFADPGLGVLAALAVSTLGIAVGLIAFFSSRPGVKLRAAGSNPAFAESVGIRRKLAVVLGLAGCNALAALAGALQADNQGFADISSGQGVLILALAALAIGEAVAPKGGLRFHQFVVVAAVAGSLAYHVIIACAVRAGLAPTDLRLATGLLVLIVVVIRMSNGALRAEDVRSP